MRLPEQPTPYGLGVGTTGLIFGAIAIAWLAYLIPLSVRRRGEDHEDVEDANRFSDSMRVVRYGTAPLLDQDLAEIGSIEVSTPLTRRAAINDLRRLEQTAARRRRRTLVALMFLLTAVCSVAGFGFLPWWTVAVPGALLVAFLAVARVSVRGLRTSLDRRYEAIQQGGTEATVFLSRKDLAKAAGVTTPGLDLGTSEPSNPGRLWDPVPITMPTYVSKPLAPRTVRTIDLSSPEVASAARLDGPVTADSPVTVAKTRMPAGHEGETSRAASA